MVRKISQRHAGSFEKSRSVFLGHFWKRKRLRVTAASEKCTVAKKQPKKSPKCRRCEIPNLHIYNGPRIRVMLVNIQMYPNVHMWFVDTTWICEVGWVYFCICVFLYLCEMRQSYSDLVLDRICMNLYLFEFVFVWICICICMNLCGRMSVWHETILLRSDPRS